MKCKNCSQFFSPFFTFLTLPWTHLSKDWPWLVLLIILPSLVALKNQESAQLRTLWESWRAWERERKKEGQNEREEEKEREREPTAFWLRPYGYKSSCLSWRLPVENVNKCGLYLTLLWTHKHFENIFSNNWLILYWVCLPKMNFRFKGYFHKRVQYKIDI